MFALDRKRICLDVKLIAKENGMSYEKLSELMGVKAPTVRSWFSQSETHMPSEENAAILAGHFGLRVSEYMTADDGYLEVAEEEYQILNRTYADLERTRADLEDARTLHAGCEGRLNIVKGAFHALKQSVSQQQGTINQLHREMEKSRVEVKDAGIMVLHWKRQASAAENAHLNTIAGLDEQKRRYSALVAENEGLKGKLASCGHASHMSRLWGWLNRVR